MSPDEFPSHGNPNNLNGGCLVLVILLFRLGVTATKYSAQSVPDQDLHHREYDGVADFPQYCLTLCRPSTPLPLWHMHSNYFILTRRNKLTARFR